MSAGVWAARKRLCVSGARAKVAGRRRPAEADESPEATLQEMGFPQSRVQEALRACGGAQEAFMAQHNLRVEPQPQRLVDAYAHAGTLWRGTSAIKDLVVSGETMGRIRCPALVMRGEHDFVTEACIEPWRKGLPAGAARFVTIAGASHHALLEKPEAYLTELDAFLREHD